MKLKAILASTGSGKFNAGDHCRFCRARNQCRTRALKNLDLLKYEFQEPALLTDDEIAEIIGMANELSKWAEDIYTYATAVAINEGRQWAGYKLVEGRTRRKYTNEETVADTAKAAGYMDIFKQSLISITEMEKLMGKKQVNELLGTYIEKPQGGLTLVPESDKRQAVSSIKSEFKVEE